MPRDFGHWTHWLRWKGRKAIRFLPAIWAYRVVLWNDMDCDYDFLLACMEVKLRRMSTHFREHGIVADAHEISQECLMAATLCQRLQEDDYVHADARQTDLDMLTNLMRRRLFCWWC